MHDVGVVAGASSEIGREVALTLARRGLRVACWGRREDALAATAEACDAVAPAGRASVSPFDVTDATALEDALATAVGAGRLAALVWCVGLFDWATADRADPRTWERLMGTNLTAAATTTAMAAPRLVEAASTGSAPALVYVGSAAGHDAFSHNAAYVASKHGLTGLARATFLDLRRHGIKVSLVSPGIVAAGAGLLSPLGQSAPERLLAASDVAGAVGFVLDHSSRGCPTEIRLQTFASD